MTDGDTHFFLEVRGTGEVDRVGWVSVFVVEGLALTPPCAIARPKLAHKKPKMYRTNCAPVLETLLSRAMMLTSLVSESARAVGAARLAVSGCPQHPRSETTSRYAPASARVSANSASPRQPFAVPGPSLIRPSGLGGQCRAISGFLFFSCFSFCQVAIEALLGSAVLRRRARS
jgi:hypothetical protein